MTKQINQLCQSLLLATLVTFIVLGSSGSVFAQAKVADKYPKPDFSEMEEYWDIVEYEYDFEARQFIVIAKPNKKTVPLWWSITWYDSKGVVVEAFSIKFDLGSVSGAKIGDPQRGKSYSPFKRQMSEVKSIKVTEHPGSGDAKLAN